jgi:Zn-dependent protease with chaperone function
MCRAAPFTEEDGAMQPMGASVGSQRVRLTGITGEAFQHPLDRSATENLAKVKGFDWVMRKFVEYGIERIEYVQNIGGAVRVGPKQLPRIYDMLRECCAILDVDEPELYVRNGPVNAITSGHDHPFIVLYSELIDIMDDDELFGVIAHELGHIKCGHVLYKAMARSLQPLIEIVGQATLGIGKLVGAGLEVALVVWDRRSELSADRAALLALQDARPCVSMLMKLAGGSERIASELAVDQFLNQARAYKEGLDSTMTDRFYRFLANMGSTHPFPVERARELDAWSGSAHYQEILAGNFLNTPQAAKPNLCPTCQQPAETGDRFCRNCGTPLRQY